MSENIFNNYFNIGFYTPIKQSRKKKNTYTVCEDTFDVAKLFCGLKKSPLTLIKVNGHLFTDSIDFYPAIEFPNPCAYTLSFEHPIISPTMEFVANTIIEYLDKETGAPVLQLYPTSIYVFSEYKNNYMQFLNHASRQDLKYEINKRKNLLELLKMHRVQKNNTLQY